MITTKNLAPKKIILLLFVTLLMNNFLFSQVDVKDNMTRVGQMTGDQIANDPFGNLYVVKDALLQKYNEKGEFLYSYSNFSLGNITSIDVDNFMKIMLFYEESSTLLFLDDRLSPITDPIDLFSKQYTTIALAAYTSDNRTWLYDFAHTDLILLDIYFNKINKTHYAFPNFQPIQLIEISGKKMAMNNPTDGIYLFDSFGTFIKIIRIKTEFPVQIVENTIYYIKEGNLYCYDYEKLQEEILTLNIPDMKQCLRYKNMLFILKTNGEVWKIQL